VSERLIQEIGARLAFRDAERRAVEQINQAGRIVFARICMAPFNSLPHCSIYDLPKGLTETRYEQAVRDLDMANASLVPA
jgi:hypothetical protein